MTKSVTVRLPEKLLAKVNQYQVENDCTLTTAITNLLERGLGSLSEDARAKLSDKSDYVTKDELNSLMAMLQSQIEEVATEVKK